MSTSAFAGSPLLICPQMLVDEGLIPPASLENIPTMSSYTVEYNKVQKFKKDLLQKAYHNFLKLSPPPQYQQFIAKTPWLKDYTLFITLKNKYGDNPWYKWPKAFKNRDTKTLTKFAKDNKEAITYHQFEQYIFYQQWQKLKHHAQENGIKLFGDLPIYVGLDSADVWANQSIFTLDAKTGTPATVAGVPPDYFSKTGQKWGNPLYRWDTKDKQIERQLLDWWCQRFSVMFTMVDVVRIDHFRGFESYWSVPATSETAQTGKWLKGPGKIFFDHLFNRLGKLNIVAEDLGIITEDVTALRNALQFPGMKVLQFAFDNNPANPFLPHNFTDSNSVIYTGTHDNETTVGWFLNNRMDDSQRADIKRYLNGNLHDNRPIHRDLIHLALSSISALSIFPLQDVLGFGNDCKMNSPGIATGNWRWRCGQEFLNQEHVGWLHEKTELFGRGRSCKSS